ncbi:MAG: 30S ribosome-binding factor RbfA [Planctomycetia bacterium]|nr:30S ribosome-binding factor RbfA [Planctomycetia bacterium]
MTSRRLLKAAQAIREVVSMAILSELKDPRVQHVTVTKVEVLPDMKQAKVYVTIMGEETQQRLALHGLQSSAGFLQHKIATRIDTRYTPRLEFIFDQGVKNTLEIDRILRRVLPKADDPFVARHEDDDEIIEDETEVVETTDEASGEVPDESPTAPESKFEHG